MNTIKTVKKERAWGYWAGSALLVLSFLSLGLGAYSMLSASRERLKLVTVPGESELDLKMPGSYVGVLDASKQTQQDVKRIQELEYLLVDAQTQQPVQVNKVPGNVYASSRSQNQVPLFEVIVPSAGKYILSSNYPYYLDGPAANIFLLNSNMNFVLREVIVSGIVFILFLGLSIGLFVKTYKARHAK